MSLDQPLADQSPSKNDFLQELETEITDSGLLVIKGIPMNYGFEEQEDASKDANRIHDPSTHPSEDSIDT